MNACPACGSSAFEGAFEIRALVSRYRRSTGAPSRWKRCRGCASIVRDAPAQVLNAYLPSDRYVAAEASKRERCLGRFLARLAPSDVVFDLGSGPGVFAAALARRGVRVVQVEPYRTSAFPEIPQVREPAERFMSERGWRGHLGPGDRALFTLIDVVEHLSTPLAGLLASADDRVRGLYLETGCVDWAYPSPEAWYYLDYRDHVFVPSVEGLRKAFPGRVVQAERISNSLHSYPLPSAAGRRCIQGLNRVAAATTGRALALFPCHEPRDHVAAYVGL